MRLEVLTAQPGALARWRALPGPWREALLRLALADVLLVALFASDWAAMARQWWNISTYNHILLIPPILCWLVWQRRAELLKLEPSLCWPALVPLGAAAFLWLLGAFSGLDLARQAGAVALLMASVPLLLGPRVTAGLLFPLAYMVFLVPVGEELVPLLQTVTARITVALVHASGVPARIDGVFIATPAGLFEVAEACSGVKFLIAMIAFGVLMANVCFGSWARRAVLVAACILVPILANGVRAWGTIYAAQFFGTEAAAGFDHIVYGWIFFALVIALVIACAWPFFDRAPDDPQIDAGTIARWPWLASLSGRTLDARAALAALLAVVLAVQGWAFLANRLSAPLPQRIDLPQVPGWTRTDYAPRLWWEPRASGAGHRLLGSYSDRSGHKVDVFYALYPTQSEGREAGGFGQGALMPQSPWAWQAVAAPIAGGHGERLLGRGEIGRVAITWYRTGSLLTGSNARLKLAVMADRLALRERPTMLLILSAEDRPGQPAESAITAFVGSLGPLGRWVDRIGGVN